MTYSYTVVVKRCRDAVRKTELCFTRIFWILDLTSQIISNMMCANINTFYILGTKTVCKGQIKGGFNSRL